MNRLGEVFDAASGALWGYPSKVRVVVGKIFARRNQRKDDFETREDDRCRGKERRASPRAAGTFLRALFLRRTKRAVVRVDRKRAPRAHPRSHAETRAQIQNGNGRAGLRN